MKLRLSTLLVIALSSVLIGCTSTKHDVENAPEIELYNKAKTELEGGNLKSSITVLETIDKNYPFGPYSQQVQLDLIYAYYKTADYPLAIASIDRFLKLNPTHPNIDWVIYMRGITNMAQNDNTIQGWFNVARYELKVAQFYTKRGAYVAVINRVTQMLTLFPDTDSTKSALLLLSQAYNELGLADESQKVDQLIQANLENMPVEKKKSYFSRFLSVFNGG